jgi:methionyl-tRNA formyltransferase
MKYAFAGDRQISCNILNYIMKSGFSPLALLVSSGKNESHSESLIQISNLPNEYIFKGKIFKNEESIKKLKALNLDYIIGIHFPYIIPIEVLEIPSIGFLNLHPAYLPYHKGWHTPSWAIIDEKPYGATLHFMSEALDEGDIIRQKEIKVSQYDTADSLYKKVLILEEELFIEAFDDIKSLNPPRSKQNGEGSSYKMKDLQEIRKLDMKEKLTVKELLDRLRALTTNNINELAYFESDGEKIGVKIDFEVL